MYCITYGFARREIYFMRQYVFLCTYWRTMKGKLMVTCKLYTEDEVLALVTQAVARVGEDCDEARITMATALLGARITMELQEMFNEVKKEVKDGEKEA